MRSTDPRDKVFGILGISDPEDVLSLGIEVDYGQHVTTLYTNLARAFLLKDRTFDIFQCLGVATSIRELPTWVPDWTNLSRTIFLSHLGIAANQTSTEPEVDCTSPYRSLQTVKR